MLVDTISTPLADPASNFIATAHDDSPLVVRILFYSIAVLLIFTALAKLWMLLTDPFADIKTGWPVKVVIMAIFFELFLGIANMRSRPKLITWAINVLAFFLFLCIAISRWLLGYVSCGCLGALTIAPWIAIFVDLVLLFSLCCVCRRAFGVSIFEIPRLLHSNSILRFESRIAGVFSAIAVFIGLFLFVDPQTWMDRKEFVRPVRVEIGILEIDKPKIVKFKLKNHSNESVTVVGGGTSCRCMQLNGHPRFTLSPNSYVEIPVSIFATETGFFHHRIVYFFDSPKQSYVTVEFLGFVRGSML